jgi:hypothetical protein
MQRTPLRELFLTVVGIVLLPFASLAQDAQVDSIRVVWQEQDDYGNGRFTVTAPGFAVVFTVERRPDGTLLRYSGSATTCGAVFYPKEDEPVVIGEAQAMIPPPGWDGLLFCSSARKAARAAFHTAFDCWPSCPLNCCCLGQPSYRFSCFLASCACYGS